MCFDLWGQRRFYLLLSFLKYIASKILMEDNKKFLQVVLTFKGKIMSSRGILYKQVYDVNCITVKSQEEAHLH